MDLRHDNFIKRLNKALYDILLDDKFAILV